MAKCKIEYQGVKGLQAIADYTGINFFTLHVRLYQSNLTIEQAVALGPSKQKSYQYQGVVGLPNIAKAVGMKATTLKARIKRGMTIEQAVEKPLLGSTPKPVKKTRTTKLQGIKYPTELSPIWKLALGMGEQYDF